MSWQTARGDSGRLAFHLRRPVEKGLTKRRTFVSPKLKVPMAGPRRLDRARS